MSFFIELLIDLHIQIHMWINDFWWTLPNRLYTYCKRLHTYYTNDLRHMTIWNLIPELIDCINCFLHSYVFPSSYIGDYFPNAFPEAFGITSKIVASLFVLILIRGGVPRYRYDFLTKLGWVKFLLYILLLW